jgi:N-methylhydantoinase A
VKDKLPQEQLRREFQSLEQRAEREFAGEEWASRPKHTRSIDVRYRGQGYELNVPATASAIREFHELHRQRYGYVHAEREVELVTLRLRSFVKSPKAMISTIKDGMAGTGALNKGTGARTKEGFTIYNRDTLEIGKKYRGPGIVTEYSATTVIPTKKRFWLDRTGNLIIRVRD